MARTVLYKLDSSRAAGVASDSPGSDFRLVNWRPGLTQVVPPGKGAKYFFYSLFHWLRIFRNRAYSALLLYDGEVLAASLLVVPTYYKWPFMAEQDVQLTYVLTRPEYRGKGLAEYLVRLAIAKNQQAGRNIWYVTNTENSPSRNLCEKVGFVFAGYGAKSGFSLKMVE